MISFNEDDETYVAAMYQGILPSKNRNEFIPIVNFWNIPDAECFGASLLDKDAVISTQMEEYAFQVLTCFCPLRTLDDILLHGSHVLKFRQWYAVIQNDEKKFLHIHRFLTNMQQLKNCLRIKQKHDITCQNFIDPLQPYGSESKRQKLQL